MAAQEVLEDPSEPINCKKWILKVSIHCEGCKRKVKKILNKVEGVYEIDIDTKQQKVTVRGNVEADTLVKKLTKSSMHAELWPEQPDQKEKKSSKSKTKEKMTEQKTSEKSAEGNINSVKNTSVKEVKLQPAVKVEETLQGPSKNSQVSDAKGGNGGGDGRGDKCKEESDSSSGGGGGGVTKVISEGGATKSSGDQVEKKSKMEEIKNPESAADGAQPPVTAENKEKGGESDNVSGGGGGGGNDGGNSGKKKKKKGQNGNLNGDEQPTSVAQEGMGSQKHEDGPPAVSFPRHHSPPRHQSYDHYQPQFIGPPGPPPVYAVSYNTANPTSSYTASYYAPPPPNSYVYSYSVGPEVQAPPSDFDPYARQPLDSFEIFSDENPNSCSIM